MTEQELNRSIGYAALRSLLLIDVGWGIFTVLAAKSWTWTIFGALAIDLIVTGLCMLTVQMIALAIKTND